MSASPPARESSTRTPYILCALLVLVVLFGNSFLTSSGQGEIDGSKPWARESILRDIAELLNLRYQFATPTGTEVKNLIFGIGAAVAVVLGAIAFVTGRPDALLPEKPREPAAPPPPTDADAAEPASGELSYAGWSTLTRLNLTKLHGAQVLMAIAVGWSFMSANWASATWYALAGSVLMATAFLWALGLGYGLGGRAIGFALRALILVSVLTAVLAIWYFYVRNPNQRAKYPIGNPLFLAAMLIPAFVLSVTDIIQSVTARGETSALHRVRRIVVALVVMALVAWTWSLTGSSIDAGGAFSRLRGFLLFGPRATLAGLVVGIVAIVFFAGGRRSRIVSGASMGVLTIAGVAAIMWMAGVSDYGRGATIRLRQYAWSYALDGVTLRPWTGLGQGGYALTADSHVGPDALIDPEPFQGRLSHAHNEWLETLADLGALGFVFVIGAYLLTFAAGIDALRRLQGSRRWELIGLLAALIAMMVEEATNVGLRLPGLPAIFFTVLGLAWALIRDADEANETPARQLSTPARTGVVLASIAVAITVSAFTMLDWQAARAHGDAPGKARSLKFDEAQAEAETATNWRLPPVRRLEASHLLLDILTESANFHAARAQERAARVRAGDQSPELVRLAEEDFAKARDLARQGLAFAHTLRTTISPSIFEAGVLEARLCGLLATLDTAAGEPDTTAGLRQRAIAALTLEADRHRLDEEVILNRLQLAPATPVQEEIDYLLGPLRAGPFTEEWEQGARFLMTRPDFKEGLAAMRAQADADIATGDGKQWKYALSPEVLRMSAVVAAANQDFEGAAELARQAADAYEQWGDRLVRGRIGALVEQSRYLLFNNPADPSAAARVVAEAIAAVPNVGRADDIRLPILVEQTHDDLAGFEEAPAKKLLLELNPGMDPEIMPNTLSRAYTGLAHRILNARQKPPLDLVADYLLRAIELAPVDPEPVRTLAQVRFAQADDDAVIALLLQLDEMTGDPTIANQYLLQMARMRDSDTLRAFREQRIPPETQPAESTATQPADTTDTQPTDASEEMPNEPPATQTAPTSMPTPPAHE